MLFRSTQYMPIFDGLATPNDVPVIAERAAVLSSLGTYLRFEWPLKKCRVIDTLVEYCMGSTENQEINGHKVSAWSFDTSLHVDKNFAGKFTSHKVNLSLEVDDKDYYIPMKYAEGECSNQDVFKKSQKLRSLKRP